MKVLNKVLLASALVMLVACSKDKEDKKTKVNAGLRGADTMTAALQGQAQAQGVEISILGFSKSQLSNGAIQVQTRVQVGNDVKTIYTEHQPGNYNATATGQGVVGGLNLSFQAYCPDTDTCNYYALVINAQQMYQLGVFWDFVSSSGIYKILPGNQQVSFDQMYQSLIDAYSN